MPKSGDHVVVFMFNGTCDLLRIDESGQRVVVRKGLTSPQQARDLARQAGGGDLWICDEATPGNLTPY
jgi:hypothetical protein